MGAAELDGELDGRVAAAVEFLVQAEDLATGDHRPVIGGHLGGEVGGEQLVHGLADHLGGRHADHVDKIVTGLEGAARGGGDLLDEGVDGRMLDEPGEQVVARAQRFVGPPAFGNVPGHPKDQRLVFGGEIGYPYLHRQEAAVLAPVHRVHGRHVALRDLCEEIGQSLGRGLGVDIDNAHAEQFFPAVAGLLFRGDIDIDDSALHVGEIDGIRRMLDQGAEPMLTLP